MNKPDLPWGQGAWKSLDCGEGWWPLISQLDRDLRELAPGYRVVQVKEKFGGLRYYTETLDMSDEAYQEFVARISAAENESERTCESCGAPGSRRSRRGWLKTLCDEHDAQWQNGDERE